MHEANVSKDSKQHAVFSRRRHTLRGSVACAVLLRALPAAAVALSFAGAAQAQSITYNGGNGSWLDPTKWTDNTSANRVPNATDTPTLIDSAGTVTLSGAAASGGKLQVLGGGEVDVLAGGVLTTGGTVAVPLINTIGLAPSLVTTIVPPAGTSSTGTMLVSGTGSTWDAGPSGVRVGNSATGTLTIASGGALNMSNGLLSVGLNAGGVGTLNIDDGTVANPAAAIRLGYDGATGNLNISNGGTLTTTNLNSVGLSDTGGAGTGTVTISGAGSNWTITAGVPGSNGNLNIGSGAAAQGTVTISAGGSLSNAGNAFVGYNSGTGSSGGTGSVTITGTGSSWTEGTNNSGALVLGYGTGASGTLLVAAGGTLNTSSSATFVGYNDGLTTGGTGKLTVDGAGSTWNSQANISVASGTGPGTTTNGTLIVSNGGTINNAGHDVYIAQTAGATGTFNILSGGTVTARTVVFGDGGLVGNGTIDGSGSNLTASSQIVVGLISSSANSLTISNGGTATAQDFVAIGLGGGTGTINVTGQGSTLNATNRLYVGTATGSTGTLNIANNAIVSQTAAGGGIFVGYGDTGTGNLNITTGGQLKGATLALGYNGPGLVGNLTMASGGQLSLSGAAEIGYNGGTGTASVTGQGTAVNVAGYVSVGHDFGNGGSTTGTLTVADSATLTTAALYVGQGSGGVGTLNVGAGGNAGVITAPIFMGGQSSIINFNHTQANYVFSSAIADATTGAPTTGSVNFIGSGNTTLTAVNTYTSATNVTAGTLTIAAGGSIANSSLTTIASGATLAGAGSLGNVSVASGATVAPTGTGTLTTKAITFAAGSTYQVGITAAGQSSNIAATTATLQGGTVQVNAGTGNYVAGTNYTILSATGGVTGKFASLVGTDMLFLNSALDYSNPDQVNLSLTRNNVSFASVATTANQRASAGGLASLAASNPLYAAVVQQNSAGAQAAFDALSGEAHASAQSALINNALAVGDMINNRLSQPFDNGTSTVAPMAGVNSFAADDSDAALNYAEGDKKKAPPWPMAHKAPVITTPPLVYAVWAQGLGDWMNKGSDGNAAAIKSSSARSSRMAAMA
jgi:T5SS/PEP-CTERM-associated repeat protein